MIFEDSDPVLSSDQEIAVARFLRQRSRDLRAASKTLRGYNSEVRVHAREVALLVTDMDPRN